MRFVIWRHSTDSSMFTREQIKNQEGTRRPLKPVRRKPYCRRGLKEVTMQKNLISMIATPLLVVCGLLFTASSARADDDDRCTDKTLRGDYGFAAGGVLICTPWVPAQETFRSVLLTY